MLEVAVLRAIPEIQRQKRQPETFVLCDMPHLVTPYGRRWLDARDDDMAEGDRAEAAPRQNEMREPAITHVEKAAVPPARASEREQAQDVPDRIGVVRDEGPAEGQGMDATTSSTAARTSARLVNDESSEE